MNTGVVNLSELIGLITAFLLTLAIFSYIVGDNIIFRIAASIFVGASAGLAISGVILNVLWPRLLRPLIAARTENLVMLAPLILGMLTFSFLWPRIYAAGAVSLAFLAGIGAATIIGGAVLGTIVPLIGSSINSFDLHTSEGFRSTDAWQWINHFLVLIGLITALWSFRFTDLLVFGRQHGFGSKTIQTIGRCFIAIALGVIFFGVLMASQAALVERVQFLKEFFQYFITPGG